MTFNKTKEFCASIPGHRMAMTKKNTQIEVLKDLQKRAGGAEIWVDLVRSTVGLNIWEAIWGDGTPYKQTEASQVVNAKADDMGVLDLVAYRFRQQGFYDNSASKQYLPLCQANPLDNDEW
ncbi:hypothetical protein Pcinc_036047 [Petrolisthes cinctipes]|uniref:Uncharacterized protein n=1 Tax=Petrolisthes cinctipes TaxID=88211 RepID=A0AAE1BX11_PETCI|nr:hypothetical protein Pcinc_036047 [Petrolisthes cinctipes]